MAATLQECSFCGEAKPAERFRAGKRQCLDCEADRNAAWRDRNPEKVQELRRARTIRTGNGMRPIPDGWVKGCSICHPGESDHNFYPPSSRKPCKHWYAVGE